MLLYLKDVTWMDGLFIPKGNEGQTEPLEGLPLVSAPDVAVNVPLVVSFPICCSWSCTHIGAQSLSSSSMPA